MKYYREYQFKENVIKNIAINLRKYRKEKGLTLNQVAALSGKSFDFLRKVEAGKGKVGISLSTLHRLCLVLGITPDDLTKTPEEESDSE